VSRLCASRASSFSTSGFEPDGPQDSLILSSFLEAVRVFVSSSSWAHADESVRIEASLTEDGLWPDCQISGLVPIDDVISQHSRREIQVASGCPRDFAVARQISEIKIVQRNIQAASFDANVQQSVLCNHSVLPYLVSRSDERDR